MSAKQRVGLAIALVLALTAGWFGRGLQMPSADADPDEVWPG